MEREDLHKPDVEAIMERIRREVRADSEARTRRVMPFSPVKAQGAEGAASPLLYSEDLNYLNAHWQDWYQEFPVTSHRRILGRFIVFFKKFVVENVWRYMLKEYLHQERDFHHYLVRCLNAMVRYIDSRDAEIFWQLVEKIDSDVKAVNERTDDLFEGVSAQAASVATASGDRLDRLERQEERLRGSAADIAGRLDELESSIGALRDGLSLLAGKASERRFSNAWGPERGDVRETAARALSLLEDSEEERFSSYADLFSEEQLPIAHIGARTGVFLEELKRRAKRGIALPAEGSLSVEFMQKGLEVFSGNGTRPLGELDDGSLGGAFYSDCFAGPSGDAGRLLSLLRKKVRPEGKLLVEGINPQSLSALSSCVSLGSRRIVPAEAARVILEACGFEVEGVLMNTPVPEHLRLKRLDASGYLPPRFRNTVEGLNENIEKINDALFGYRRYCVVAKVPRESREEPRH